MLGVEIREDLTLEVVNQASSNSLRALLDHNVPDISVLVVDIGKAPDLRSVPPILEGFSVGLDHLVLLDGALTPSLLEESLIWIGVLERRELLPCCDTFDGAEDMVLMLAPSTLNNAVFARSLNTSSAGLLNVDVSLAILFVLFCDEGDCHHGDGFADEPTDSLERQDSVRVVR